MGQFHIDEGVNAAFVRLLDALTSWERSTGRKSVLVFVPENSDEQILLATDGKILPPEAHMSPQDLIDVAMSRRN